MTSSQLYPKPSTAYDFRLGAQRNLSCPYRNPSLDLPDNVRIVEADAEASKSTRIVRGQGKAGAEQSLGPLVSADVIAQDRNPSKNTYPLRSLHQRNILSLVCKTWNIIVLGTAPLWTRLSVPWWCPTTTLIELLERSGGMGVEMMMYGALDSGSTFQENEDDRFHKMHIIRVLASHSYRLQ
ncbi:hypothetical protein BT96DRAFT_917875 [Gymnopus androsaceus JB14]|uniref:Uncharacterized protein n=1 Tax=Gymnopus androsaceus JB14 TaxID=1447944 RepID=A0A6A4I0G8_9AGAR|nr:hypothetical protein BT96DRAFT_917875 [Gymnopus androsaceus JB14]